jgi:hypothetical protein
VRHLLNLSLAAVCFVIVGGAIAGRIHPESMGFRVAIGAMAGGVGAKRLLMFIFEERDRRREARGDTRAN